MEAFLAAVVIAATPFLLAATGELVAERAGVLNLGVEGMMLMGAVAGFAGAFLTGSGAVGVAAGALAGIAMAAIFALVALVLMANQAATGLALTIFGVGVSGLVGQGFVGETVAQLPKLSLPGLSDSTMAGRILLTHDAMVYAALALLVAVGWFLGRTRAGLALRAVGDGQVAAHALGWPVRPIRIAATLFGGAMAGLGGACLSLAITPMWGENMTAGRGWIALALVVFAGWRPGRLLLGAYLFAAVTILQFYLTGEMAVPLPWDEAGLTLSIPSQVLAMAPYLATILALVLISGRAGARMGAPACLGQAFRADR